MLAKLWGFIKGRVTEASTARAVTLLAGLISYTLAPEHAELIGQLVVAGLIAFGFLPDSKKEVTKTP